jgi:hypothetical protein
MTTKISHGVTLWAVPRFHRSEIAAAQAAETGVEWVNRLKTYSFPLTSEGEAKKAPASSPPDQPETCH